MLDGKTIPDAIHRGVREALVDRARAGYSSVVQERDGRIRWIPPDEMLRMLGEPPIARPVPPPEV
jgi:hypothetical protein